MQNRETVARLLSKLPFFSASSPITVKHLTEGESNLCFKVTQSNKVYFTKYIANNFKSNEADMTLLASKKGISPSFLYSDDSWIITEFLPYTSLARCNSNNSLLSFSLDEAISTAIQLMAQCHQLYEQSGNIKEIKVNGLLDELNDFDFISLTQINELKRTLAPLFKLLSDLNTAEHFVLCHGDINFSNIMIPITQSHGKPPCKAVLIDFECSGYAEREFDLAMMLAINDIPFSLLNKVILEYEKAICQQGIKVDKEKLIHYMLCAFAINALWYWDKYKQESHSVYLHQANKQKIQLVRLIEQIKKGSL